MSQTPDAEYEAKLQAAYLRACAKPFGEETWEERYATLAMAVRDTDFECDEACDSHGHTDACANRGAVEYQLCVLQASLRAATERAEAAEQDAARWRLIRPYLDVESMATDGFNYSAVVLREENPFFRNEAGFALDDLLAARSGSPNEGTAQ